jgi:predicted KAP-like P-loop ATPase
MFQRLKNRSQPTAAHSSDTRQNRARIRADKPIRNTNDDTLGRAPAAQAFAKEILELDWSEGFVAGVLGAWGSGKTSFINLARDELEASAAAVVDFNPWMFSGAEQLLYSFFSEIAAQLRLRRTLSEAAETIEAYGSTFSTLSWLPLVGAWIARGHPPDPVYS